MCISNPDNYSIINQYLISFELNCKEFCSFLFLRKYTFLEKNRDTEKVSQFFTKIKSSYISYLIIRAFLDIFSFEVLSDRKYSPVGRLETSKSTLFIPELV
jgi:hypothetical protein